MNFILGFSFEKPSRVGTLTCTLTAQALLRSSGKLSVRPHLRLFHGVPVGELAEVGGEEDDVGDEDDADIVRHLGQRVTPLLGPPDSPNRPPCTAGSCTSPPWPGWQSPGVRLAGRPPAA